MVTWTHRTWTWRQGDIKQKMKAQVIYLNLFTFCSLYKQNFVIYQFVDEETNISYPFANGLYGLYGLNGLAHL
jgi:hypothetical protein